MPSPFPGMNPWLEQPDVWHEFHNNMLVRIQGALAAQVRPRYIVKHEVHLYIQESGGSRRFFGYGDVGVTNPAELPAAGNGVALLEGATRAVTLEWRSPEEVGYLEIRDRRTRRLVTILELLSPANKYAGDDRDMYVHKRETLLHSEVNFVEIDLLRGGPRMPIPDLPDCDYCLFASPVETRPQAGIWANHLAEALPTIPIPLGRGEAPVRLNLQELLHQTYDANAYADYIYQVPPEPRLTPEQEAWAQQFLPADAVLH